MSNERPLLGPGSSEDGIAVLVVTRSLPSRSTIAALLQGDRELKIVGWASTLERAVRAVGRLKPDVVALESDVPLGESLDLTRRILRETPTPIVGVVVEPDHHTHQAVRQLIESGVLSVVRAWNKDPELGDAAEELRRELKTMSRVPVIRRHATAAVGIVGRTPVAEMRPLSHGPVDVVAVGASTGGPQALHALLSRLPATFSPPVLVVQHMTPGFIGAMVEWLKASCPLPVQVADHGASLDRPGIHVAPSESHMTVRGRRLALVDAPPVSSHRPSATVLFESVGGEYGESAAGILLTGMGDDGAAGLGAMKRAGALTMAQDEATSVVFGMPAVAIELGFADHVLTPADMAGLLLHVADKKR